MKELKKSKGGARANSGRKPGGKAAKTFKKEEMKEALRQHVFAHMGPLVTRMIAASMGIGHLFKRDATGKFTKIEDEKEIEQLMTEGTEGSNYWIFAKDPSVQAFTDLMNRAIDKPIESVEVAHSGGVSFKWETDPQ